MARVRCVLDDVEVCEFDQVTASSHNFLALPQPHHHLTGKFGFSTQNLKEVCCLEKANQMQLKLYLYSVFARSLALHAIELCPRLELQICLDFR